MSDRSHRQARDWLRSHDALHLSSESLAMAIRAARIEALEEAAKVCDHVSLGGSTPRHLETARSVAREIQRKILALK